jgi:hypothetical protein
MQPSFDKPNIYFSVPGYTRPENMIVHQKDYRQIEPISSFSQIYSSVATNRIGPSTQHNYLNTQPNHFKLENSIGYQPPGFPKNKLTN